jgi:hypothetical protein
MICDSERGELTMESRGHQSGLASNSLLQHPPLHHPALTIADAPVDPIEPLALLDVSRNIGSFRRAVLSASHAAASTRRLVPVECRKADAVLRRYSPPLTFAEIGGLAGEVERRFGSAA